MFDGNRCEVLGKIDEVVMRSWDERYRDVFGRSCVPKQVRGKKFGSLFGNGECTWF